MIELNAILMFLTAAVVFVCAIIIAVKFFFWAFTIADDAVDWFKMKVPSYKTRTLIGGGLVVVGFIFGIVVLSNVVG